LEKTAWQILANGNAPPADPASGATGWQNRRQTTRLKDEYDDVSTFAEGGKRHIVLPWRSKIWAEYR